MRSILNPAFASALLMAAASADTQYYEAYGAPIASAGVPTKVVKIGIGIDDS